MDAQTSQSKPGMVQSGPASERLYVTVPARVKEWLREEATEDGLSTAGYARRIIMREYRSARAERG